MIPKQIFIPRIIKGLLLLGIYEKSNDVEQSRKLVLVNSISLFAITVLLAIGIVSYGRGDTLVALLDMSAASVLIFSIVYLRRSGKQQLPIYVGMGLMTILFVIMFISGGAANTGFLWYYTYPTFALYLLGKKKGAIANIVLFIPALIYLIIIWPEAAPRYSQNFTIRFIPSVFCVFLFSYLFETTRDKTHHALESKQRELESLIAALSEKEYELQKAHADLEQKVESRTRELRVSNKILKREIAERKRSEENRKVLEVQLIRAKKMEAIGILAGGVAHDLNNILSGVVSYPELLLHQLPADNALRQPLETIHKSGRKAAAIVQDLLTMARRGVNIEEVVNLNDVIANYLTSPEYETMAASHPNADVRSALAPDLSMILGSLVPGLDNIERS